MGLGRHQRVAQGLGPCIHTADLEEVPGFVLAQLSHFGLLEDLSPSFCLYNFNFSNKYLKSGEGGELSQDYSLPVRDPWI